MFITVESTELCFRSDLGLASREARLRGAGWPLCQILFCLSLAIRIIRNTAENSDCEQRICDKKLKARLPDGDLG